MFTQTAIDETGQPIRDEASTTHVGEIEVVELGEEESRVVVGAEWSRRSLSNNSAPFPPASRSCEASFAGKSTTSSAIEIACATPNFASRVSLPALA